MALSAQQTSIVQLVTTMFNAAPGSAILAELDALVTAGRSLTDLASDLSKTGVFTDMYPATMTDTEFATAFINNLVGTTLTDAIKAVAVEFTVGQMNAGLSREATMKAVSDALVAIDNTDANFGVASATLENKIAAAANFSETQSGDLAALQGAISAVTDDVTTIPPVVVVSSTVVELTNGTDTATANVFNSGLVFTPGGDDRINALQDEDTLTGEGQNATLNATLGNANDNGATTVTPTLTGIDTVNVKFSGSGGTAVNQLDLQDATGLANAINIERINDGVATATIDNIGVVSKDLSVKNSGQINQNVDLEFTDAAVAGSTDATNLTVSNVDLARLSVQERAGTVDQGIETINLMSTGSTNSVDLLRAEDLKTLNITGDKNLNLGGSTAVTGTQGTEATTYAAALGNVAGSLTTLNAGAIAAVAAVDAVAATATTAAVAAVAAVEGKEAFTGNLSLTLGAELNAGLDNTSGVSVQLGVIGGTGDDTFRIAQGASVDASATNTDTIDGGAGANTLVLLGGAAQSVSAPTAGANLKNLQALEVRTGHDTSTVVDTNAAANAFSVASAETADVVTIDADAFDSLATIFVRNEGQGQDLVGTALNIGSKVEAMTVNLNDLTAAQAAAVTIAHGTTGNNGILGNTINLNLKDASGTADSVAVTLVDGVNADARSNFILGADGKNAAGVVDAGGVESVTINDTDTEDNTVALVDVAAHTSKITLTGGQTGKFFNLDTTTTGGNGGLYGYDVSGATAADTATTISDLSLTGTQTRIVADEVDASAHVGNVVLRVSSSDAANGSQKITTGTGDDTVIFDNLNDNRAGLTISDTVAAGAGTDTLVIDGNLTVAGTIALGASEWTNVSGFENIRLVNAGAGSNYNLTVTDALIAANQDSTGLLNIINDHDSVNDTAAAVDIVANAESAVTIDARTLSATSHFTYNGEEGTSRTTDRFILSDANLNGGNIIDGGAVNNIGTAGNLASNLDILEARNSAVVTVGDLAGVKNVGNINFNNDQAITQTLTLQLNDTVVDAMADSYHTSTIANSERITITAADASFVGTADAALNIDATALTGKSAITVVGAAAGPSAADDSVSITARVAGGGHNINLGGDGSTTGDTVIVTGTATTLVVGNTGTLTYATGAATVTDTLTAVEVLDLSGFTGAISTVAGVIAPTFINTVTVTGHATVATTLVGGTGSQTFNGGTGIDTFTGGVGIDTITTGAGADVIIMDQVSAANANNVLDFTAAVGGDSLNFDISSMGLNAADYIAGTSLVVNLAAANGLAAGAGANHVIVDTAANIALYADAAGSFTGGVLAVASDTGAVMYDVDGNFATGGTATIGTLTITGVLDLNNFDFIA